MNIKRFIPRSVRMFFGRLYADILFDKAIKMANEAHKKDGRRYFVFPTTNGDLKVTNADFETRDRKRDKRVLKKSAHSPYLLRKESFYFTASKMCKNKYVSHGMMEWEIEANRKVYHNWYFRYH